MITTRDIEPLTLSIGFERSAGQSAEAIAHRYLRGFIRAGMPVVVQRVMMRRVRDALEATRPDGGERLWECS